MEILGVGGWELVTILIIVLVVAGPKRMIRWSYVLGRYLAMLRRMWAETATMLQKEFDQAGLDVTVPKDIPTRQTLNQEVAKAVEKMSKPVRDPLDTLKQDVQSVQQDIDEIAKTAAAVKAAVPTNSAQHAAHVSSAPPGNGAVASKDEAPPQPPPDKPARGDDFGTWSG